MISAISSGGIQAMVRGKDNSSEEAVKSLERQKDNIQKQIDEIRNGKEDMKAKQELIKPLEQQIQEIESQIQQEQMDNVSNKNDNSDVKSKKQSSATNNVSNANNQKIAEDMLFLNSANTYKQIKSVNSIKKGLMGRANELNSDADMDEMTGNLRGAEKNRSEAAANKGRASGLESKIGELNHKINADVKNTIDKTQNKTTDDSESVKVSIKKTSGSDKDLKEYGKNNCDDDKDKSIDVHA